MKSNVLKAAFVAAMALFTPTIVFADYITDAIQALKRVPVYVAAETEETNTDTAARLRSRLNDGDNIVLVMLPASATKDLGVDITTIATRLSEELGNKRIIGLAVGNEVVGYARNLPAGVAADQMGRAKSVSNDPFTALGTFVQNIHIWQVANPQPTPEPEVLVEEEKGFNWITLLPFFVGLITFLTIVRVNKKQEEGKERTRFKAPDHVSDLLARIASERQKIDDSQLKTLMYQMCLDIEKYFQKSSGNKKTDSVFFQRQLEKALLVLEKYVEVQNNQRYFHDPLHELARGKSSLNDFAEYVLESIRRGNSVELVDFEFNTRILEAQRYR